MRKADNKSSSFLFVSMRFSAIVTNSDAEIRIASVISCKLPNLPVPKNRREAKVLSAICSLFIRVEFVELWKDFVSTDRIMLLRIFLSVLYFRCHWTCYHR